MRRSFGKDDSADSGFGKGTDEPIIRTYDMVLAAGGN
jgi:hypothetical protein